MTSGAIATFFRMVCLGYAGGFVCSAVILSIGSLTWSDYTVTIFLASRGSGQILRAIIEISAGISGPLGVMLWPLGYYSMELDKKRLDQTVLLAGLCAIAFGFLGLIDGPFMAFWSACLGLAVGCISARTALRDVVSDGARGQD